MAGRSRLTAHPGRLSATGVSSHLSVSALSVSSSAAGSVSAAGGKSASGVSPAAVTHSPLDPNTVEQLRNNMQVCDDCVVVDCFVWTIEQSRCGGSYCESASDHCEELGMGLASTHLCLLV